MRPFGLGPRDVVGLAREAQAGAAGAGPVVVSGPGAADVAAVLGAGADPGRVLVGGDPAGAAAVVRVLAGPPGEADEELLRSATRAGALVVALVRDAAAGAHLPYVLAEDVISWPDEAPVPTDALARAIATGLRGESVPLAAGLPALRDAVVARRARDTAATAAALALLRQGKGPLTPVLSLLQARMLRSVEVARGVGPPAGAPGVAAAVGPELVGALATGAACRALVRSLPVRNRAIDAAVAFGATLALATVADRALRRR